MNRELSRRFLDAFIGIEQQLRSIVEPKSHRPFYQLVNGAAPKNAVVHDTADELKHYADLRNVIVHERLNNEPIAEPHREIVERLEHILQLLCAPPKVEDSFMGDVVTCRGDDTVGKAASIMYKHRFSKMPVYDGDAFRGLLTAEGVTHWLGDHLQKSREPVDEQTVAAVLEYVGNGRSYAFVARTCPIFRVIDLFEEAGHEGHRLQAVLITEDGSSDQKPLGIITVFDLPQIYQLMEG